MITRARVRLIILAFVALLLPSLLRAQTLLPTDDVAIQMGSNGGGQNNGHLQVQYSLNGQKQNQSTESLIRFDLSPLLASVPVVTASDVQSANLILFVDNGGTGGNVTVCELAASPVWSSATITGTTIPGCSTQTAVFAITSSQLQNGAFISIPITMIVQSWLTSGVVNNGLALVADAPTGSSMAENMQFDSLGTNGQGFAPMIEVVFNNGVTSLSTGSGLKVNNGAGPATGIDTLTVDTTVIATNASVNSAVSGGVTTAENFASTAANNAQTIAEGFATTAANNAQSTAEGFATTAANNAVTTADTFATMAANNAVTTAEGFATNAANATLVTSEAYATTAVASALNQVGTSFLSLTGGTVSGAVTAQSVNTVNTFQIGGADVLKADASFNTASGFGVLASATTASENDAHGYKALSKLTSGIQNAAHGKEALKSATTASQNAAHGYQALLNEISGNNNVAHGMQALKSHMSGDDNTAIGTQTGLNLLTGEKNVLIGKLAGQLLSSTESKNILINHDGVAGDNNTIRLGNDIDQQIAYMAGVYEKDHSANAKAKHVLIDTTTGQLGIDPNAPQTTVASVAALQGLIASTVNGSTTLSPDTTYLARQMDVANAITTAQTTAQGLATAAQMAAQNASLSLASGGKVTAAVEAQKLNSDTTLQIQAQDVLKADANFNTATGFGALVSAAAASENDAHGYNALSQLTSGIQNAAHGKEALKNATTASQNAAHGYQALLNEISGNNNVAHGMQALKSHTSGDDNTVIGTQAALNLLTGERNVLLGKLAGQLMTSNESDNILINHAGDTGVSNEIRIGTDGTGAGTQQKTSIAGIFNKVTSDLSSAIQVLIDKNGNLGTVASSRRYKEDIHDMGGASEGLLRLRPVTFRYKQPNDDGSKPVQYGLIAEEVAEVYPDLVVHGKDGQIETVQYYKLDAMLLNEVQKLSKANTEDQAEIATLRTAVAEQLKQGQEQQAAIKQLLSRVQTLQAAVASEHSAKRSMKVASTAVKKKTHVKAKHPSGAVIASVTGQSRVVEDQHGNR